MRKVRIENDIRYFNKPDNGKGVIFYPKSDKSTRPIKAAIEKDVNMKITDFNLHENKPTVFLRGLTYASATEEKGLLKKFDIIDLNKIPAEHGQPELSKIKQSANR